MTRHVPLKSQRLIVLVGLPLVALILHTTFCDWHFRHRVSSSLVTRARIVGFAQDDPTASLTNPRGRAGRFSIVTGLYSPWRASRSLSIVCGVVVPLTLVGITLYLHFGWRHTGRITRGLCPKCSYDLCGDDETPKNVCPECGWKREVQ